MSPKKNATPDLDAALADVEAATAEIQDPNAVDVIRGAIATIREWHESAKDVTVNPDAPEEPAQPAAEAPDKPTKKTADEQTTAQPATPDQPVIEPDQGSNAAPSTEDPSVNPGV